MNDTTAYTVVSSIPEAVPFNAEGILSRPLFSNDHARVVAFSLAKGQEMTEHTTSMEAHLQFLSGRATLTLGGETQTAEAGTWARMEPRLAHSIVAEEDTVMVLTLFKDHKK
jgi:quercetin dioxygenase-like cupin family protein